ncbi:response regulator transcription factor [Catenulispora sp. GP43]|uniref:response regulator transcription factor n=1 Tax=Catenulispora sp. GP43 TaxID=3156263 RepID=UPI0035185F8E
MSGQERDVLAGIAAGLTHRQIARRLAIKESTVDTHMKRIRLKRKLGNKADLVRLAVELGLVEG